MIITKDNPYYIDILEFTDDNRLKKKKIEAELTTFPGVESSININILAPAIRSTEKKGEFNHLFFKTADGLYLSLENDDFYIDKDSSNLFSLDDFMLSSIDNFVLECLEEGDLIG